MGMLSSTGHFDSTPDRKTLLQCCFPGGRKTGNRRRPDGTPEKTGLHAIFFSEVFIKADIPVLVNIHGRPAAENQP